MFEWFNNLPAADPYTFVGLGFSALSTILSLVTIVASYAQGKRSQKNALNRLREKLFIRISSRRLDKDLLSIQSILSLAKGINLDTNSPSITEYMIAESIRLVGFDLESVYKDTALKKRLHVLNRALEEFEPLGPKLASISSRDRMRGYLLSLIPISITPFLIYLALLKIDPQRQILYLALVLPIEFALALLGYRAYTFWRQNNSNRLIKGNLFTANPNSRLDFFIFQAHNQNQVTLAYWGCLWEGFSFFLFPMLSANFIIQFAVGGDAFWPLSKSNIKICLPILFIISIPLFVLSHGYRLLKVMWLKNRLNAAQCDISLQEMGKLPYSELAWQRFLSFSKRLYVITGSEMYRANIRHVNELYDKYRRNKENADIK